MGSETYLNRCFIYEQSLKPLKLQAFRESIFRNVLRDLWVGRRIAFLWKKDRYLFTTRSITNRFDFSK